MKILKYKIQWILTLIFFFLTSCTSKSPEDGEQAPPSPVIASTVTCPKEKDCNINNYEKYIYKPGTKCHLSCVKISEVNTTNWAWDNIPSKYSKGCDALKNVKLVSTLFVCADLVGLNLSQQDLSHSNLSGANLSYANLQGAILNNTNMKETIVIGANLDTDLTTTNLTNAIYNKKTTFPKNFSPELKKMLKNDYDHSSSF